ncbi:uncharacterized protein V1516DRAFT_677726 [Lipomyces oligophaga]|uniref:uncharacterized protein n=1 Tax=Lipomyces oligophaga TaxID=45792 RepID=UPI0034CE944F
MGNYDSFSTIIFLISALFCLINNLLECSQSQQVSAVKLSCSDSLSDGMSAPMCGGYGFFIVARVGNTGTTEN